MSLKTFDLSTVYIPTERQRVFHSCPADILLYGGAAGGGKSEALLWDAFLFCVETPNDRALLLRRHFPELDRSLIQRSLQKFPREICSWSASRKEWHFKNGSVLEFGYCAKESDVYQFQSAEYGYIGFDELTHFTRLQWEYLVHSRLRSAVPGAWPRARGATNPGGVGHLWVKELFVDPAEGDLVWEDELGTKRAFIPAKVSDNPHIMKNDPDYVKRLERLDEKWRKALLEGDWSVFAGQYYTEWDETIHIVRPFPIPEWWKKFRSLDYGLDTTACYWWAVSPEGQAFIYRELYEKDLTLSQAARTIDRMTPGHERIIYTTASPDLWNRRQDTGVSGVETMTRAGLRGLVKADNRRVPGWRTLREYLTPYENEQGVVTARLQIFNTCTNLIRTLPALVHSERNPEDVADGLEDHAPESVRYGVMSHPPTTIPEEVYHERSRRRRRIIAPVVSSVTGY